MLETDMNKNSFMTSKLPSDQELIPRCIELIRTEQKASVSLLQRRLKLGYGRAGRIMDELEKRGIVGPSRGGATREILTLPDAPAVVSPPAAGKTEAVQPASSTKLDVKPVEKPQLPLGQAALCALCENLAPTDCQMTAYLESGQAVPNPMPASVARILKFKPVSLFEIRGLTTVSCTALGLRANPPANETFLLALQEKFSWDELLASGTWLEANRKAGLDRRPNAQFHGKGQMGKKPESERRGKDDKWVWGYGEPVLIPYVDEAGELIKLRPHKGGAPAGTLAGCSRIYVPRDYKHCASAVEKFKQVVICEGEFKAMAIWQTLGLGARLQVDADGQPLIDATRFEPVGVCALPGISYVKNVELRMDLDRWLKAVGCRLVKIAFDDEDKSHKPLNQRFDALIAARALAIDLSKTLHLSAQVCVLPKAWRNQHGKSDWDGALAKIIQTTNQKDNL